MFNPVHINEFRPMSPSCNENKIIFKSFLTTNVMFDCCYVHVFDCCYVHVFDCCYVHVFDICFTYRTLDFITVRLAYQSKTEILFSE